MRCGCSSFVYPQIPASTIAVAPAPEVRSPAPKMGGGDGGLSKGPAPEFMGPAPGPEKQDNNDKGDNNNNYDDIGGPTTSPPQSNGITIAVGICVPIIIVAGAAFLVIKLREKAVFEKNRRNLLAATQGVDLSAQDDNWGAHQL